MRTQEKNLLLIPKTSWSVTPCIAYESTQQDFIFATRKACVAYVIRPNKVTGKSYSRVYLSQEDTHLTTFRAMLVWIQAANNLYKERSMAVRWNPKPTVCFRKSGSGIILVSGKEVVRFDDLWNVTDVRKVETFYQGIQEAILMVGAASPQMINELLGDKENDPETEPVL